MAHNKTFFTLIVIFSAYILIGIVFLLVFPDQDMASARTLQEDGGFSRTGAFLVIIVRSVIQVLFWPGNAFILLFG